jgi:D-amino-acid dehydrogenase
MAAGSGQLLADLIQGRCPAISTEGLALDRYQPSPRPGLGQARGASVSAG